MPESSLTRFLLDGAVEHKDGQQFVNGKGLAGDSFERVHRIEPHGFASVPVAGGIGALFQTRSNRDSAYVFGGEHPGKRPVLDGPGASALYHADGTIWKLLGPETRFEGKSKPMNMAEVAGGEWLMTEDLFVKTRVFIGPGPGYARVVTESGPTDWLWATVG